MKNCNIVMVEKEIVVINDVNIPVGTILFETKKENYKSFDKEFKISGEYLKHMNCRIIKSRLLQEDNQCQSWDTEDDYWVTRGFVGDDSIEIQLHTYINENSKYTFNAQIENVCCEVEFESNSYIEMLSELCRHVDDFKINLNIPTEKELKKLAIKV